MEQLEIK